MGSLALPSGGGQLQQCCSATEQMLKAVKLDEQYLGTFIQNNIFDISDLVQLNSDMLAAIGITNSKHKKKILQHIQYMTKHKNQAKYFISTSTLKNNSVNFVV